MACTFSGIFADGDKRSMLALLREAKGKGRLIEHPFRGFGVRFSADRSGQQSARDFPLVKWSATFPEVTFVYLYVECFGGTCDHGGFAFRDANVLQEVDLAEGHLPLRALLRHLDIQLGEHPYFEPLERDYFERSTAS